MKRSLNVYLPGLQQEVSIRSMTVEEIDIMASPKSKDYKIINDLIDDCIENLPFPSQKLLEGDRHVAFMGIRRATFGDELDIRPRCPECKLYGEYTIDLSELECLDGNRAMVEDYYKEDINSFPFEMEDGTTLTWKFLNGSDTKRISEVTKNKVDSKMSSFALLRIIDSDGKGEAPLKRWITKLPTNDLIEFQDYYNDCNPGMDDKVELQCQNGNCLAEYTHTLKLDPENFFRPTKKKKKRAQPSYKRVSASSGSPDSAQV